MGPALWRVGPKLTEPESWGRGRSLTLAELGGKWAETAVTFARQTVNEAALSVQTYRHFTVFGDPDCLAFVAEHRVALAVRPCSTLQQEFLVAGGPFGSLRWISGQLLCKVQEGFQAP